MANSSVTFSFAALDSTIFEIVNYYTERRLAIMTSMVINHAKRDHRSTNASCMRFVFSYINRFDSRVVACEPGDVKVLGSNPVANRNFF